jgi:hypothetical protein
MGIPWSKPAQASSLTTILASDGGWAGNTFDVEVLNPKGIRITSFDVNIDPRAVWHEIYVYWRPGTAVGFEGSSEGWELLGIDAEVNSLGRDAPTPVRISSPAIAPGSYGFYVDVFSYIEKSEQFRFTSGSGSFENADLRIVTGTGRGSPAFTGGSLPDRQWNGTIHYLVIPEPSSVGLLWGMLAVCTLWMLAPHSTERVPANQAASGSMP